MLGVGVHESEGENAEGDVDFWLLILVFVWSNDGSKPKTSKGAN